MKADVGLIGLAVMGQNLVLNMNDKGFSVAVYNRTPSVTEEFLSGPAKGRTTIVGAKSLEDFVAKLASPRKIILLVKAGEAVDETIARITPLLDQGDLVIDSGNSYFEDSERRAAELAAKGLLYIGTGVSGGEEGARNGPSMMPGGASAAWPLVKGLFEATSAKTDKGEPCCAWIGNGGSGHFVKMVHNGIEYGDMQLIAETYQLMRDFAGLDYLQMAAAFRAWNETELDSYLVEITADILRYRDSDDSPLAERILDAAGQKGTGKWMSQSALDAGVPLTLITEAVYARALSALLEERRAAAPILSGPGEKERKALAAGVDRAETLELLRKALLAAKIVSYAQGFMLLRDVSKERGWSLDFGSIALTWRGGCIIRSVFLDRIKEAFDRERGLASILIDPYFASLLADCQKALRRVVALSAEAGIPSPALASALAFYDGYRSAKLPANLIQAQRDYFGAHTYERTDRPRGEWFHTDWTGKGGKAVSGTYNA